MIIPEPQRSKLMQVILPDFKLRRSQGYLGKTTLKRANVNLNLTEAHKQEFILCANDITYFTEKYMKLVDIDIGLVPFVPFGFQSKILEASSEYRYNAILLSRQMGKTSAMTAIALHYVLFNQFKNVAIIANKAKTAREILKRIATAYESLPKWLQQGVEEWNKGSVSFENNCTIFCDSPTASSIRGYSISLLILDEVAFIPENQYEEFFKSVYPTISSGKTSRIFMVSTPNGRNHWYNIVNKARKKESDFHLLEFDWRFKPGRDEEWKQAEIRNTSAIQFAQEHENSFIGTSGTLVAAAVLSQLVPYEPIATEYEGQLRIWEQPQIDRIYFVSVDVSEGLLQDYSTMSVIDITELPYRQVAAFRSNTMSPLILPTYIYNVGQKYNTAYVMVERNNLGYSVLNDLNFDLEYPNILFIKTDDPTHQNKFNLGMETTKRTKRLGCLRMKDFIESNRLETHDENTIDELWTFIEVGNSYEAEENMHDDMVMSLVNFSYYATLEAFKDLTIADFKKNFKNFMNAEITNALAPIPYFDIYGTDPETQQSDGPRSYAEAMDNTGSEFARWLAE